MDVMTVYRGSDMLLEVEGLTDEASGDIVNTATVSATLKDAAGATVAGETWPKTMPYVANTSGVYRALLPATLVLAANARYTAEITALYNGYKAFWTVDVLCKTRRR